MALNLPQAKPELLSLALSSADPDLLRTALTNADPQLLKVNVDRAKKRRQIITGGSHFCFAQASQDGSFTGSSSRSSQVIRCKWRCKCEKLKL